MVQREASNVTRRDALGTPEKAMADQFCAFEALKSIFHVIFDP